MAHYDSTCSFCGEFGMFANIDCSCEKATLFRKTKLEKEMVEAQVAIEYLKKYKYPCISYNLTDDWQRKKLIQIKNWLLELLKERQ